MNVSGLDGYDMGLTQADKRLYHRPTVLARVVVGENKNIIVLAL